MTPSADVAEINTRLAGTPILRCAADVRPEPVKWLWGGRIPIGKYTDMAGDPGAGKSSVMCKVAAAVTTGIPLPGDVEEREPGNVIIASAEEGAADTIRPRLDAAGADVARVFLLEGVWTHEGDGYLDLSDPDSLQAVEQALLTRNPALVVLDPITAVLGNINSHRDADVRGVLGPVAALAEKYGAAIVGVRHLRKSAADAAIYRPGGSIAFTAAARSQLLVGQDPAEPTRRAVAQLKNSLGPLADPVGFTLDHGSVRWMNTTDLTAARMLAPEETPEARSARGEAAEFLRTMLSDGPVPSEQLRAEAESCGLSWRTIRRAARDIGVEKRKTGFKEGWTWALPRDEDGQKQEGSSWPPSGEPEPPGSGVATFGGKQEGPGPSTTYTSEEGQEDASDTFAADSYPEPLRSAIEQLDLVPDEQPSRWSARP